MKYNKTFTYKGYIVHMTITDTKGQWSTEDVRTGKKYGASTKITDGPLKPEVAVEIYRLLYDQMVRTINHIQQTAGQKA